MISVKHNDVLIETAGNDHKALNLTVKITLDRTEWKRKIHVADPS